MATLIGQNITNYIGDLCQVSNTGTGIDGTLRPISGGTGTSSALQISTAGIKVAGTMAYNSYSVAFGGNFSTTGAFTTAGAFTLSGAYSFTGTLTAATTVTYPTAGTLSTLAGIETLTNKTLTSPIIGTSILDTNGNILTTLTATSSAVNYINISNNTTGNAPRISAVGDATASLTLQAATIGIINLESTSNTPVTMFSGTAYQHSTTFAFSNTAAARTITFQDSSDTIVGRDTTDTLTNKTLTTPTVNQPVINGFTDASHAASGVVGEVLTASASTTSISTGTAKTLATLALTAGDWEVWGEIQFVQASTATNLIASVSKTTNTLGAIAGIDEAYSALNVSLLSAATNVIPTRPAIVRISTNTNYYLVAQAAFASTCTASGIIIARRIR